MISFGVWAPETEIVRDGWKLEREKHTHEWRQLSLGFSFHLRNMLTYPGVQERILMSTNVNPFLFSLLVNCGSSREKRAQQKQTRSQRKTE